MSPKLFSLLGAQPVASEYRTVAPSLQPFLSCRVGGRAELRFLAGNSPRVSVPGAASGKNA